MKKLFLVIAFAAFSALGTSNAQQVNPTDDQKVVTHDRGNYYDVVTTTAEGKVLQIGQYYKEGDTYKTHGIWKLYDRNTSELITKAEYDKGKQLWVETKADDGKIVRIDQHELTVKRLEERIAVLEKQIEELQETP